MGPWTYHQAGSRLVTAENLESGGIAGNVVSEVLQRLACFQALSRFTVVAALPAHLHRGSTSHRAGPSVYRGGHAPQPAAL